MLRTSLVSDEAIAKDWDMRDTDYQVAEIRLLHYFATCILVERFERSVQV